MLTALKLYELFAAASPGVAEIIMLVRRKDGTIAIMPILDEADAQFDANIAQIKAWMKANTQGG